MNLRRPPRAALWTLKHAGIFAHNAALAGDLLEEFGNGRTSAWFWRQTVMALVTTGIRRAGTLNSDQRLAFAGWVTQLLVVITFRVLRIPVWPQGAMRWWGLIGVFAVFGALEKHLPRVLQCAFLIVGDCLYGLFWSSMEPSWLLLPSVEAWLLYSALHPVRRKKLA